MAINPYEPELAKRQRVFQLATKQLTEPVNLNTQVSNQGKPDFIGELYPALEASPV